MPIERKSPIDVHPDSRIDKYTQREPSVATILAAAYILSVLALGTIGLRYVPK